MTMRNRMTAPLLAAITIAFLSACSSTNSGDRPRYQPPSYASPSGSNNWEVNCGRNRIIIDNSERQDFYKEDGTQKSQMEFCNEMRTTTRIKRK